ncbi:hypothetical protein OEA41_002105 [Lepraria neglecta]|uniref:Heterokaryon incompatibility domain-containing protein n=1 Tax=Lepraria neglecta TaxID=209136 RepID=A0AAD9ZAX8_9LECA|nr:hypothetical protein OEA41_002105 [Lepraria neglecta]
MGRITIGQNFGTVTRYVPDGGVEPDMHRVGHNYGSVEIVDDQTEDRTHQRSTRSHKPISPYQADLNVIKSWLQTCEHHHPSHSEHLGESHGDRGEFNGAIHESLAQEKLPRTIRDALDLTYKLDELYLWVDVLCILQDDKRVQIQSMSEVYSNAILTIVAGVGESANAGLPRVNYAGDAENSMLQSLQEGDTKRRRSPSCAGFSSEWHSTEAYEGWHSMETSRWISRAWTYQETILSKRLLLVLRQRMMLACGHSLFEEGMEPDTARVHPRFGSFDRKLERRNSLECYEHCVFSYTRMNLTLPADILRAFEGILSRLRLYLRSRFIFGLPETEIESALAWQGGEGLAGSRERTDLQPLRRRKDPTTGRDIYPSWSWAGWVGGVHYDYALWPIRPCVAWQVTKEAQEFLLSGDSRGVEGDDHEWKWQQGDNDPGYYVHPSQPQMRFANPTAPEDERPSFTFLLLDDSTLHFIAMCVSLETVDTETLRQIPHVQPTLQSCPLVDDEDFLAGTIDISVVPLELNLKAEFKHTGLPFALRPIEYRPENNGHSLQMIALFRFTGSANTEEHPHFNARPITDPRMDDVGQFTNICHPNPTEDIWSSNLSVDDYKIEGADDHIWTYDPRRYQPNKYYPFYKVLLVEWKDGIAYRLGIGQVHVDAFHYAQPYGQLVALG